MAKTPASSLGPPWDRGETIDVEDMKRGQREADRKENMQLEESSLSLEERVKTADFTVDSIVVRTDPIIDSSKIRYGSQVGPSPSGYSIQTTLQVTPYDDIPVRILEFYGFSALKKEDRIRALMPVFEEEKEHGLHLPQKRTFYLPRDYRAEELAIQLELLDAGGHPLRTERSAQYANHLDD